MTEIIKTGTEEIKTDTLKSLKTEFLRLLSKEKLSAERYIGIFSLFVIMNGGLCALNIRMDSLFLASISGLGTVVSLAGLSYMTKGRNYAKREYNIFAEFLMDDVKNIARNDPDAFNEINQLVVKTPGLGKAIKKSATNITGKKQKDLHPAIRMFIETYKINSK